MKKKVWVASPICFVLAAAMLIMALISWFTGHKMVFFIEAVVAVVAILAIAIVHIRFQSYVYTSVKAAKKVLFGKEYDALQNSFTMPMAIVGECGGYCLDQRRLSRRARVGRAIAAGKM